MTSAAPAPVQPLVGRPLRRESAPMRRGYIAIKGAVSADVRNLSLVPSECY